MLVSHDYQFIYIKTKKTASTSLQEYFKPYCKQNGIIEDKKAHRPAESIKSLVGDDVWNSYIKICPIRNPWDKMVSNYFWKKRLKVLNFILNKINPKWSNYNPAHEMSFARYLEHLGENCNIDRNILFVNNEWPDYYFIRYEHLHNDLREVCQKLGIPFNPGLIPTKKNGLRREKSYEKFYDDRTKKIVEKAYFREIEKFGYEF